MLPKPKPPVRRRRPTAAVSLLLLALWIVPGHVSGQTPASKAPSASADGIDPSTLPGAADRPEEMDAFLAQLLASSPPPASEGTFPQTSEDLKRQGYEALRDSGHAPVVATPDGLLHPYGHGTPSVVCIPDRACDIALEAGEVIDGLAVGDPERWQTTFLTEGVEPEPIPHILFQPTETDLATNLVVVTSRRTYHVELRSPSEDELAGDDTVYQHLRFWYPDSWTRRLRAEVAASRAPDPKPDPATPVDAELPPGMPASPATPETAVELDQLDFGYEIDPPWRRSRRLPWRPTSVFDDGRHVYVHLPPSARATDLPIVLGRAPDGSTFPVNTHVRSGPQGDWIVLPALFDELELVTGTGEERRFLRIRRRGPRGGAS